MDKKTKKIETPIDQRETFVSIQKSFADSDLSVGEKLQTLYALQQADTAIDKILQLRGELPMEVEALEAEIAELKAKSTRLAEMIDEYGKFITENKLGITECDAQIEKYRSQLENVANSREYDSLNKEIENQGLLRQIAEKHISEAKERIFDKKNDLEVVKEKIAVRTEDLKAKKQELATIVESTSKEEERLFKKLGEKYIQSLEDNSIQKEITSKHGVVVQKQYYVRKSKYIIDEIDKALAKHYGFTEEELDFIINYDIKYRMGDELNEE